MRKQYRLRWKPKDAEDLQRAIKKFNRRVASLEKANPTLKGYYPEKATFDWYKDVINTRYDLKREIRTLEKFSKEGMDELTKVGEDAMMTKWQLSESKRRIKYINEARAERFERVKSMKVRNAGEVRDYTKADFGFKAPELAQFNPLSIINENPTQYDVRRKWRTIVKQSSKEYYKESDYQWRRNYIESLERNFGSDADEIIKKIKDIDIDEYLNIAYGDTEAEIYFNYTSNYLESVERLKTLYRVWGLDTTGLETKIVMAEGLEDSDFM